MLCTSTANDLLKIIHSVVIGNELALMHKLSLYVLLAD